MRIFSLLDTNYSSYISRVEAYLSKNLSNFKKSFGSNTVFGQIISVVGNAIQNVMLYIEDALVEQNKYTAQRKKSIWGLAALSGYNADLGKAASVNVTLTHKIGNERPNIVLKNHTSFTCTQNGLNYTLMMSQEAITLNTDIYAQNKILTLLQGSYDSDRYVSTGGQLYTINMSYNGNIDMDYLKVYVNNELWEYAPSVYDMYANGKQYTYKNNINGGISLIFGNGAHGKPLFANDIVDVEYFIHDGENGNIDTTEETYFVFNNVLTDTNGDEHDGNALFNVVYSKGDQILSGSNSESLYNVREMIGLNSRSLVLASPNNYKLLLHRFGFCGYNKTWTDSSGVIKTLALKNYASGVSDGLDYFNLTEDDFLLSENQKNSIKNYIENCGSQLVGTTYIIEDPILCKYAMWVYVKLSGNNNDTEAIKLRIKRSIGKFFTNHIYSDIYVPKSDIIHLIKQEISDIDGIDIYFISEANETAIYNKSYIDEHYEYNKLTGEYEKYQKTVKLYDGENPNLGLDIHGNIYLKSELDFPILMGGWSYMDANGNMQDIGEAVTIIFED